MVTVFDAKCLIAEDVTVRIKVLSEVDKSKINARLIFAVILNITTVVSKNWSRQLKIIVYALV